MNKKILTIIFTLFVAGLLTVSCSSKDKTGPSSDNGDNPTIPTIPENGTGIGSKWVGKTYIPKVENTDNRPIILTLNDGTEVQLTTEAEFSLTVGSDGSVTITMPKLNDIGFGATTITIPAKNIIQSEGTGSKIFYNAQFVKTIKNDENNIEYFYFKSDPNAFGGSFANFRVKGTLIKLTAVKGEDGKFKVTEEKYEIRTISAEPGNENQGRYDLTEKK
ncbi:hypothetical protein [Brachyspira pulli]|uniref:hypothetical protein n=1 Tax=Brachyspira pulli TaxID=310721 RepID=UPI00300542E7